MSARGDIMHFYRDTWVEVDLDAIYHNVSQLKKHYALNKKMFAVVKADGYGHGAVMVAKTALRAGADYLAVATLDEAIELRKNKLKVPILLLGNMRVSDLKVASQYKLIVTIHSIEWLKKAIASYKGKKINVHFKVDTGMHRIGFLNSDQLKEAVGLIQNHHHFKLNGIFTHMATAEEEDETYYRMQVERFKQMLSGINTKHLLVHSANSAATVNYDHDFTSAVRNGIMIYGLKPKADIKMKFELKQAIYLYAKLIQVKQLKSGSKISYNGIYETKAEEWIGTLAIGYADGWDRRMQDGQVYIDGHYCPVVGRICMDQTMIKLPYQMKEGTIVELIGHHVTVDDIAKRINTINYHTVCQLTDRLPRIYKRNGKVTKIKNRRLQKN